jgi:hypothetical protein
MSSMHMEEPLRRRLDSDLEGALENDAFVRSSPKRVPLESSGRRDYPFGESSFPLDLQEEFSTSDRMRLAARRREQQEAARQAALTPEERESQAAEAQRKQQDISDLRGATRPFRHVTSADTGQATMTAAGYAWIGLDSFVKRDDSLAAATATQSLHRSRIGYTLHENADLLGFGTSAISEVGGLCVQNHREIEPWADAIGNTIFPFRKGVQWSREQRNQRNALTDLMCNLELPITPELANDNSALGSLAQDGLVDISEQRVTVTPQGRFVLHQLWGDSSPQFRWASAL